ncbi:hypothetical protein Q8A67_003454 [Cirrhinus molitorella]|uniref:Interleukin-4 n=1 Tax=Cirrhinus molitorella TaxID=172907 RepID=A0AA88QF18_9TELE|nr:hypothetical protein Q8A67_003454 [Cirrhinus molitorella]
MAFRIERCTAGLLLLLSVLHTSQSAHIAAVQMANLGQDALTYLEKEATGALKNDNGSHSVGCIEKAKEHEQLNCSIVSAFFSYFEEAAVLKLDRKLADKLKVIMGTVESLRDIKCGRQLNKTTCKAAFPGSKDGYKHIEKLRSLLVLYLQWIVKPMQ